MFMFCPIDFFSNFIYLFIYFILNLPQLQMIYRKFRYTFTYTKYKKTRCDRRKEQDIRPT